MKISDRNANVSSVEGATSTPQHRSRAGSTNESIIDLSRPNMDGQMRLARLKSRETTATDRGTTANDVLKSPPRLNGAMLQLKISSIGDRFRKACSEQEKKAVADDAIRCYTTNSTLINAPIREGKAGAALAAFKDAVNYGIRHSPDYGTEHPTLDRRVNFPQAMLEKIFQKGELFDPAFMSTSSIPMDENVNSNRNTLLHIEAKYSANVASRSPDPHAEEHLLVSDSTLELIKGNIRKLVAGDSDSEDGQEDQSTKATIWMRQKTPPS